MSNIKKTFFCFITISFLTLAQDTADSLNIYSQSTQLNKHFSTLLDDLDFYLDLQNLIKTFLLNIDPNTKWLWTSFSISSSISKSFQLEINFDNMTLPFYQNYLENSKFNPYRYALGMM